MDVATQVKNWKRALAGWSFHKWPGIETNNEQEYRNLAVMLDRTMREARQAGYKCTSGGAQNSSGGKRFWISSGEHRLMVSYVPKPRKQVVADTSIKAYHEIDFSTQRGIVANAIMERTERGLDVTRNEIAAATGILYTSICGRVKEILNLKIPIRINGKDWRLTVSERRESRISGMENKALRFVEWQEETPAQSALF